jgi:hypothetical protein
MIINNTSVIERVKYLLSNHPATRDDDARLLANMWFSEVMSTGAFQDEERATVRKVLAILAEGKLSSSETITRNRRKA